MKSSRVAVVVGSLVVSAAYAGLVPAAAYARSSPQDDSFLQQAHQFYVGEAGVCRLAADRGTSPDVRRWATQFALDHERLDQEVRQVAAALGVALPEPPDPEEQMAYSMLANAT